MATISFQCFRKLWLEIAFHPFGQNYISRAIPNQCKESGLNSLNITSGVLIVATGFLAAFSPIPMVLPWDLIYAGLILLAGLSVGLARRNLKHGNVIAFAMILVLLAVIVFAYMVPASAQIGSL
jgi:hypothetical protein